MAKRAERLYYLGGITRSPKDHFRHLGVPPRDVDKSDIARLSDDEYAQITGTPPFAPGSPYSGPLYSETKPETTEAVADAAQRAATAMRAEAAATQETADVVKTKPAKTG